MHSRWLFPRLMLGVFLGLAEVVRGAAPSADPDPELVKKREIARSLVESRKYAQAESAFTELVKASEEKLGPNHRFTLRMRANLAGMGFYQNRFKESEAAIREVLRAQTEVLGAADIDTVNTRNNLTALLMQMGQYEEGIKETRKLIESLAGKTGKEEGDVLALARNNLAGVLMKLGRVDEAEPELRWVVDWRKRQEEPDGPKTLGAESDLIALLIVQKKTEEALEMIIRS